MKTNWRKVVRDGKVAVLVSPGFGAGWSTWADEEERAGLTFDAEIVEALERGTLTEEFVKGLGYASSYLGGIDDLKIVWVPEGAAFEIHEYDGSESLQLRDVDRWNIA